MDRKIHMAREMSPSETVQAAKAAHAIAQALNTHQTRRRSQEAIAAASAARALANSPAVRQAYTAAAGYADFISRNRDTIEAVARTVATAQRTVATFAENNPTLARAVLRAAQLQAEMSVGVENYSAPEPDTEVEQATADLATELAHDDHFLELVDDAQAVVQADHTTTTPPPELDPRLLAIIAALVAARGAATLAFDHPEVKAMIDDFWFIIELAVMVYALVHTASRGDSN